MAYKSTETTIAADVPTQLADFLEQQRTERKQPKKEVIATAIKLWVGLPKETQAALLDEAVDIEKAQKILNQAILDAEVTRSLATLSSEQKALILEAVKLSKSKNPPKYKFRCE